MADLDAAYSLKRPLPSAIPTEQDPTNGQLNANAPIKQESSDAPEPPAKRRKRTHEECAVCCEELYTNRFPKMPHANAIKECRTCFACWGRHIIQEVEIKDWDKLGYVQCGTILTTEEYDKIVRSVKDTKQVNASVQRKATGSYLRHDLGDGECFVTCPSSACKGCAIMTDGHIFTCPDCKARYCFSCNAPMHEDMPCQEFLAMRKRDEEKVEEERLASATLKEHSNPCPDCKARLQKNGGCDHFTWKLCKHEFCWLCLAPYRGEHGIFGPKGNTAHTDSCRYHPRRLPAYQALPVTRRVLPGKVFLLVVDE